MKRYFILALLAVALLVPSGVFAQAQTGVCPNGNTLASNCTVAPTIDSQPSITVTSPANLEAWWVNPAVAPAPSVTWTNSGFAGAFVKIDLLKGGFFVRNIVSSTPNNGSYKLLQVPADIDQGSNYSIVVTSISNSNISGTSSGIFSIMSNRLEGFDIRPVGNSWAVNTKQQISWYGISSRPGRQNPTNVKIELVKAGVVSKVIVVSTKNTGHYEWAILSDAPIGSGYQIKVTDVANPREFNLSNSYSLISITSSVPETLTLKSPKGGENWVAGGTYNNIEWAYNNSALLKNVKIELLKGGVNLGVIVVASTQNTNNYLWTIASTVATGSDYKIKISDDANPGVFTLSNAFSITNKASVVSVTNPTLQSPFVVTAPIDGSCLVNSACQISWTKSGTDNSSVQIDLLKGGAFYRNIAWLAPNKGVTYPATYIYKSRFAPNDGLYNWKVPAGIAPGFDYSIMLTSTVDSRLTDTGTNFTITSTGTDQTFVAIQPTVSIVGNPVLKLGYDSAKKESSLNLSATIKVTAGSSDTKIAVNNGFFGSLINNLTGSNGTANDQKRTVTPITKLQIVGDDNISIRSYVVPAGKTASFKVQETFNPLQMFAGSYYGTFAWAGTADGNTLSSLAIDHQNKSNVVTIVGEKSPYISNITSPSSLSDRITITGVRFNYNDILYIGTHAFGMSANSNSVNVSPDGTTIGVILGAINGLDLTAGVYPVYVSDPITGNSNSVNVTLGGVSDASKPTVSMTANGSQYSTIYVDSPVNGQSGATVNLAWTSTNATNCAINSNPVDPNLAGSWSANLPLSGSLPVSPVTNITYTITCFNTAGQGSGSVIINVSRNSVQPTVSIVSAPTLKLNYDSAKKESSLVANATVKVTAGSADIPLGSSNYLNLVSLVVGGRVGDINTPVNVNNDNTTYTLVTSTMAGGTFIPAGASATFKITRTMSPQQMFAGKYVTWVRTWINDMGSMVGNASNAVTIVGEKSPYLSWITNIVQGSKMTVMQSSTVTMTGVRLTLPMSVSIDTQPVSVGGLKVNGTSMSFILPTTVNVGQHSLQVSNSTGASNVLWFSVVASNLPVVTASSLTVTSPNGNETFNTGSTQTVTWTSAGTPAIASVRVSLYKGGVLVLNLVDGIPNTGSYSWKIPTTLAAGDNYKIRVMKYGLAALYDESNANFTVAKAPAVAAATSQVTSQVTTANLPSASGSGITTNVNVPVAPSNTESSLSNTRGTLFSQITSSSITVTSPNSGETWPVGSTQTITWTSSGPVFPNVNVYLYRGVTLVQGIVEKANNAKGSWTWTVPTTLATGNYTIRVSKWGDSTIYDVSDASFSVTSTAQSITVTSPNGNETFNTGSTQTVTWTSAGTPAIASVRVSLYKGGVLVLNLVDGIPNTGSYSWKIPTTLAAGDNYKIRVMKYGLAALYDESNANFTVAKAPAVAAAVFNAVSDQESAVPSTSAGFSCVALANNLQYGANDTFSAGAVSELQGFLQDQGYLSSDPTGYFGNQTFVAVKVFQSVSGIEDTGYVGNLTRAKIEEVSCR